MSAPVVVVFGLWFGILRTSARLHSCEHRLRRRRRRRRLGSGTATATGEGAGVGPENGDGQTEHWSILLAIFNVDTFEDH